MRCAIDGAATSPNWTPAFAGVRWWLGNSDLSSATRTPAQAGVQSHKQRHLPLWIPASAGIRDSLYGTKENKVWILPARSHTQTVRKPYNPDAKLSSSSFALAGTSSAALLKVRLPLGPMTRVCGLIVQL